MLSISDMRRLTTGIRSEKCVVRRFRRCANVIQCTYTNPDSTNFDVLLTVHLSIFILVINQLDAQSLFYNKFISCFYMFRVLLCSSWGGQNCIILHLVSSHSVGGRPVHRSSPNQCTGRPPTECDDTRDCIIQFCPPDDEHMYSKNVEAWNKLIIKFRSSSWLILRNKLYDDTHVSVLFLYKGCLFGND